VIHSVPPEDIPGTSAKSYINNAHAKELKELAAPLLLRRTKDLLNLPEKFRQVKLIDMADASARQYRSAEKDFRNWVRQHGGAKALDAAMKAEALVKMTRLRELAAIGKIPGMTEEIRDYLKGSERPLVVMAHHRKVIDALDETLREEGFRVGRIDGSTKDRQKMVDDFQAGKLDVLLCSISAAGVGLTLTNADTMFFAERVWRPFDLRQAEDRIHRIGQKSTATIVYYDAPKTIDEALSEVIDAKIANADAVLGDGEESDRESVGVSQAVLSVL
jgi:SWI/SNF-related matrix-associated actin-dependent regulator of chromatin subfamily A-like protein 1